MLTEDQVQETIEKRIEQTDNEIGAVLKGILKKKASDLNEEEIGFLRARASYVDETLLGRYASVLAPVIPALKVTSKKEETK